MWSTPRLNDLDGRPGTTRGPPWGLLVTLTPMGKPNPKFARTPARTSTNWSSTGLAPFERPLAVTVDQAAEFLAIPRPMAARLARDIAPYTHADGSSRWSLRNCPSSRGGAVRSRLGRSVRAVDGSGG